MEPTVDPKQDQLIRAVRALLSPSPTPAPVSTPAPAATWNQQLASQLEKARMAARSAVLKPVGLDERSLLEKLNDFHGGSQMGGELDKMMHANASGQLTEMFGKLLRPQTAALAADATGLGNESLSGLTALVAGRPFFGKTGFDWNDVASNREGQDRAIAAGAGNTGPLSIGPATDTLERAFAALRQRQFSQAAARNGASKVASTQPQPGVI